VQLSYLRIHHCSILHRFQPRQVHLNDLTFLRRHFVNLIENEAQHVLSTGERNGNGIMITSGVRAPMFFALRRELLLLAFKRIHRT
jgi:hypothetical protein